MGNISVICYKNTFLQCWFNVFNKEIRFDFPLLIIIVFLDALRSPCIRWNDKCFQHKQTINAEGVEDIRNVVYWRWNIQQCQLKYQSKELLYNKLFTLDYEYIIQKQISFEQHCISYSSSSFCIYFQFSFIL